MYKMTAAHRTYPFDTMVRVTNLSNGKSAVVRITDRGPFVENRVIDLSFAAAQEIESIGPGVVRVRIEVISGAPDPTGGYFTVQVGAFRERANAERLRRTRRFISSLLSHRTELSIGCGWGKLRVKTRRGSMRRGCTRRKISPRLWCDLMRAQRRRRTVLPRSSA
jgi:hypothetical protein